MMKRVSNKVCFVGKGIENNFNTLPLYQKLTLLFLSLFLLLSICPVKVLITTDYKTNDYIKSWQIRNRESFTIEYTHSVQLTPVSETYIINGNDIILVESYFQSYGAGLPSTTPYEFEITDKGFRIYDINEVMENLIYGTGTERANHKLIINDNEYEFLEFTKPRISVEFNVKKIMLISYIVREVLR
ncbi:DUF1850 domain-containing protein [Tissierella carlieri]|uniref:DUF1850 domain-containing protein n=1 Tax=Tissierella carlieri TaxID=689904 RepID=A0ABT1S832_9FIRM|nr:DUF1850 domain-containing protein [Tissierella carlieri]MCQ4922633.1 DUF1850 domain-containing protein [Tissierella carlieri]